MVVMVFALLYGGDGGGVGGGASDAQLFELFHQRGFVVAQRAGGVFLGGNHSDALQLFAHAHGGQHAFALTFDLFVHGGVVHLHEAVEGHHFALSLESAVAAVHGDNGLLDFGICHLRGDGALPNEVIEALLLIGAVDGGALHVGGANGFVGLLGAFRGSVVLARLAVFGAHFFGDVLL